MLFRLDFTQNADGKLLVDAHASHSERTRQNKNSCAVLFADAPTFRGLDEAAELDAVRVAESQPETPTCCLQAELSDDQLDWLNLGPVRELYKS